MKINQHLKNKRTKRNETNEYANKQASKRTKEENEKKKNYSRQTAVYIIIHHYTS